MTIDQIKAEVSRLSAELWRVASALDFHAGALPDVADRGALHRLQRVAHDTAIALRHAKLKF